MFLTVINVFLQACGMGFCMRLLRKRIRLDFVCDFLIVLVAFKPSEIHFHQINSFLSIFDQMCNKPSSFAIRYVEGKKGGLCACVITSLAAETAAGLSSWLSFYFAAATMTVATIATTAAAKSFGA